MTLVVLEEDILVAFEEVQKVPMVVLVLLEKDVPLVLMEVLLVPKTGWGVRKEIQVVLVVVKPAVEAEIWILVEVFLKGVLWVLKKFLVVFEDIHVVFKVVVLEEKVPDEEASLGHRYA